MTLFGITLSMKSLAVIVVVALLVLAVLLVVPSYSWAAAYEWFTHPGAPPCACLGGN
jgi:hypothetical protein